MDPLKKVVDFQALLKVFRALPECFVNQNVSKGPKSAQIGRFGSLG